MQEPLHHLLNDYRHALMTAGYGMSRKELKQKDRIDIRPITNKTTFLSDLAPIKPEYNKRVHQRGAHTIFDLVPCFQEGVLQINTDRYVHWILKDMDGDAQTLNLFLQDYSKMGGLWSIGVRGTARYRVGPNDQPLSVQTLGDVGGCYSQLYTLIDPNTLPWSKQDVTQWETVILANARKTEALLRTKGTSNFLQLAHVYARYMPVVNAMLAQHKPKTLRQAVPPRSASKMQIAFGEPHELPLVKKRRVGLLEIQSATIPRSPSQQTLRTYRLPSWKTRGHVRTYKSGKQVYIKESVHHRKQFDTDGQTHVPRMEITVQGRTRRPT